MEREHLTEDTADEYALGVLDPEDRDSVAAHIASCPDCLELVNDSLQVAASIALAAPFHTPPPALLDRVYEGAGIRPRSLRARLSRRAAAIGAVAAILVAVAAMTGVVWVRGQVNEIREDNHQLQAQVAAIYPQEVQIAALTRKQADSDRATAALQQSAQGDRELLLAMMSPDSIVADVFSVDESASAIGRLVWDDEQKRVWFVANKLPARPSGETYQVWVDSGGRYVSLGTFNSDATGYARYVTNLPGGLKGYQSALVTIERAGGAPERSGPSVFVMDLTRLKK